MRSARRCVGAHRPVHGGDVARSYAVDLADGRTVFAKTHPAAPAHFFTTEAAGLRWLRDGVEPGGPIAVPEVLAVSDDAPEPPRARVDRRGRCPCGPTPTASGGSAPGWPGCTRPAPRASAARTAGPPGVGHCRTTPPPTWAEFYATQPAAAARAPRPRRDALPPAAIDGLGARRGAARRVRRRRRAAGAAARRPLGREPAGRCRRPALAGGSGRARRPPRVRPRDDAPVRRLRRRGASTAYEDVAPLAPGWEERVPLHQIAPLVVHAIKFGGGYVASATEAIARTPDRSGRPEPGAARAPGGRRRTSVGLRRHLRDDPADQVLRAARLHPQPARAR